MSQSAIRSALEVAIDAMTPALPTAWQNLEFDTPAPDTPYQQVFVIFATPDNPEMGDGYRELGYMQVNLLYPQHAGTLPASTRAAAIRELFRKNTTFSYSGVSVVINRTPAIESGFPDDGRWNVPVKIPFHANCFERPAEVLIGEESGTGEILLESGEELELEEQS